MAELHEISLAIGELRAEVKANRDAMSRVEDQLVALTKQLIDKHTAIDQELGKLKMDTVKHATVISVFVGAVVLFGKQIMFLLGGPIPK